MMKISTRFFGEVEYTEEEVITFTQEMPGLEDYKQFLPIPLEADSPFTYLQSVDEENLVLLVVDPFHFFQDYDFAISEAAQLELDIQNVTDVEVRTIVSVNEKQSEAAVNLIAPILIHVRNKKARQLILHDSPYSFKHKLPLPIGESV
ncbi:flagellar assembly protein FliW [Paenibacillus puerhi]|uniref:flagellar assembly protein FliW n=1 Tax=Paenibacillus puerhi TaxID=2692622 RepID=UPI0013593B21|nr:flagellar assembly protein FliW [Paenibacillus puerhi]